MSKTDVSVGTVGKPIVIYGAKVEYGWVRSGVDAILNLGTMDRAVMVRQKFMATDYFISDGSWFPFKKDVYDMRFKTINDAVVFSSKYIAKWIEETNRQIGI